MKKAIISIHDVSPFFQREIEIILEALKDVKKSFLVTTHWNDDPSLSTDFLISLADEDLVVHGLTHKSSRRDYLGNILLMSKLSCKEFYGLNEFETTVKIQTSRTLFEDMYHRKPTGFIPPMWYHNNHSIKALKSLDFIYTESETAFINLRNEVSTFSIPVCFDFGNNKLLSHVALYGWKYIFKYLRQSLVRFSIHPSDIRNGFLPDILEIVKWLQSNNYTFLRYIELIKH
jgi:predicted deacetylase